MLLTLQAALPQYESLFSDYVALAASERRDVDLSLALDPQRLLGPSHIPSSHMLAGRSTHGGSGSSNLLTAAPHSAAAAAGYDAAGRGAGSSSRGVQQQLQLPSAGAAAPRVGSSGGGAAAGGSSSRRNSAHVVGSGQEVRAEDGSAVPQEVGVLSRFWKNKACVRSSSSTGVAATVDLQAALCGAWVHRLC
jgi:hypothetical protein